MAASAYTTRLTFHAMMTLVISTRTPMRPYGVAFLMLLAVLLDGCASKPPVHPASAGLPALEPGWSRLYLSAGEMSGEKLSSVHQVGPVTFNGQVIAHTARKEHSIVDVRPGSYPMSCAPAEPDKNYAEERTFTLAADKTYFLACDMQAH